MMLLKKYEPRKKQKPGDMLEARRAVLSRSNLILWNLVRSRYEWMNAYIHDEDRVIIEIGAGMGVAREFIKNKNIVLTDVSNYPWIDRYLDAMQMDLDDNSVDVFICNAVLHHFVSPYKFIRQASEKLKDGGRIIFLEPYTSFGLRLGNRIFDLEGWNEQTDVFHPKVICNNPDDPWSANLSVPKLMFQDKNKFERVFKQLRICCFSLTECLVFALSGGVNWRVFSISFNEKNCKRLFCADRFLVRLFPSIFAMACRTVIKKSIHRRETKYSFVIPCYNEEENICRLVKRLENISVNLPENCRLEWILVENGSIDRTREEIKKWCYEKREYKIVYVDNNRGYGYGIKQGIKVAEGDYIGWFHADLQIDPGYIIKFIKMAESIPEEDRVLFKGRRKNRSFSERFFTNGMTIFASSILKCYLNDIGAVPVMMDRKILTSMQNIPDDFTIEVYIYWMAKKAGYAIKRIPVIVRTRKKGTSSWNHGLKSRIFFSMEVMRKIWMMKKEFHSDTV